MLRSNFHSNSGAEASSNVRIVAASNLLTMAFYLESKIINDSHALVILWLLIHAGTNQPNWSQTQVSYSMYLAKPAFVFYPNCLMFQQQLPIIGFVRPRNRWANQWRGKWWKKLRLTRCNIFWGQKNKRGILKVLEHSTGQTMAWVVDSRVRPRQENWTISHHHWKSVSLTQMKGRVPVNFG